jgi:Tfp pilus assembly protein PilZ
VSVAWEHRRRWRRRTVRILVEYTALSAVRCETATTLGAGGLYVETASPLPRGTSIRVRFRLPGSGPDHAIDGRVAWTHVPRQGGDQRAAGMGIEFLDPVASSRLARELEALPE